MIRRYEQEKQPSLPPHQDNESPVVCLTKLYRLLTPVFLGFSCGSAGKESACNVGDLWDPWVGKIPWRRERLSTPVFWPGEFQRAV